MAPALRRTYGLTLGETGVLISATLVGSVASLIPWGLATDRVGERIVLVSGLAGCGVFLLAAARAHGFWQLALLLAAAGALGASVQSASGRAVMHWFAPSERGVALGIACLAGGAVGGIVLREAEPAESGAPVAASGPLRDRRIWTLSVGSALILAPQLCVAGFAVLFLHEARGVPASAAAAALAVMQLLAIGGRIGAGRWSDLRRSRIGPLRTIALAAAVLVGLVGVLVAAPLAVLVPVLVAAGAVSMSWNSLSFAAAVELAGYGRSGSAIGLQQTVLNVPGAAYPGLFGAFVAATTWRAGFVVVAFFPLAGWRVLRALTR